jgi:hypothetical protein
MISDDVYRSRLQAAIAALKYWVPEIKDVATVTEETALEYWKVVVVPHTAGACPFELMLRTDQKHDLIIAGELYEDLPTGDLDSFVPLVEAIAAGRVIRRREFASATRTSLSVETIIMPDGRPPWRQKRTLAAAGAEDEFETSDRHFLPYRR